MLYRYLPKSAGLRRITLHKSISSGDKMYLLLCECSNFLENLSAAALLLPALRARLCGYTGLYRTTASFWTCLYSCVCLPLRGINSILVQQTRYQFPDTFIKKESYLISIHINDNFDKTVESKKTAITKIRNVSCCFQLTPEKSKIISLLLQLQA